MIKLLVIILPISKKKSVVVKRTRSREDKESCRKMTALVKKERIKRWTTLYELSGKTSDCFFDEVGDEVSSTDGKKWVGI